MAVSGVSGIVGGYSAAFLIAEQQEWFAAVKSSLMIKSISIIVTICSRNDSFSHRNDLLS
ncbi:hypothetical protein Taro_040925 [Colocasia esculenta]|uniref:Uncharacterized protein n=1 Tax=Colocasia esculenta TaxID=4460 RepID=A0A843WA67_COLES|nr:hypothetical protein [Colocasia esculenta]